MKLNETYAAAFADFGVLPLKNRFSQHTDILRKMLSAEQTDECMIFTKSEQSSVVSALSDEIREMQGIYEWLTERAISLMKIHAPAHTKDMIGHIVASTIFFRSVGILGVCAVRSEMLSIPEDEKPFAFYVYQI